jgi:hypothetical protein
VFVVIPFQVYGYPEEVDMNPLSKDMLTTASIAPAACHILLAHSAFVVSAMQGQRLSLEGHLHKTKAITLINEALNDPSKRYSDAMLTAVTCLGRLETCWGSKEVGDMHLTASQQILRARGGRESLRQNHDLDVATSWGEISMASDQAATFHQKRRKDGPKIRIPSNMDEEELHQSTHELVQFLHQLEDRHRQDTIGLGPQETRLLSSMVFSSSLWITVYELLKAPDNEAVVYIKERVIRPSSRLACLLHINALLLEYADSPSEASLILARVNKLVVKHRVQKLELLQWLLDSVLGDNPARRWLVVRMVKATELLSPQLRNAVCAFLFDNLPADPKGEEGDRFSISPYHELILAEFGELLSPLGGG